MRKITLSIISLNLFFIAGCFGRGPITNEPASSIPPQATSAAPYAHTEMVVPEPIFNGTVFIIEAGMQHDQCVVLMHGAGDRASHDWDLVIPELAKQYHVLAFDLPGYGQSSKSNTLYSSVQYMAFMKWLIPNHIKGPFVLIGHSMGGGLALRYAAEHQEDVRRLILVDAVGILHWVSLLKSWYVPDNAGLQSGTMMRKPDSLNDFIRNMLDNMSSDEGAKKMNQFLQSEFWRRIMFKGDPNAIASLSAMLDNIIAPVDGIRTPTLLIWGDKDRTAPFRTAKALMGWLPAAHLEVIANAGHVPMIDHANEFNRIIQAEIASSTMPKPASLKIPQAGSTVGHARYDHQRGISLTGRFKTIELIGCREVRINNALVEQVIAADSEVVIEDTRISGQDVALIAHGSRIIATNVIMEADTSISSSNSHLDLAGVKLIARKRDAISTDNRSVFILSISHEESPAYSGLLHGTRHGNADHPPLALK